MKRIIILIYCCFSLIGCQNNSDNIEEATTENPTTLENEASTNEDILSKNVNPKVAQFISYVKNDDINAIASTTKYPLSRKYPLPDITSSTEFTTQYDDIFDSDLKEKILESDPVNDWKTVGYRGIMLHNGTLWLDTEGNLIAVNSISDVEQNKRDALIEKDKASLHESLKDFDEPVAIMETKRFRIRIDEVDEKYRYASWETQQKQSKKPDLIINGGEVIMDGSGGNHYYSFKNEDFTYQCHVIHLGAATSPLGILIINKSGKEILNEDIVNIKK